MKLINYLVAASTILTLSTSLYAKESSESPYKKSLNDRLMNFGGISLSSNGSSGYVNLSLLNGNIPTGNSSTLPVSFSTSFYLNENIKKKDHTDMLLNSDSGIANLKLNLYSVDIRKNSHLNNDDFKGLCAFNEAAEGICQFRVDSGVKILEFKDLANKKSNSTTIYLSAGIQMDVPLSIKDNPFQRLTISSDYLIQAFDSDEIYSKIIGNNDGKLDKLIKQVDIAIDYSISRNISIQLNGTIYSDVKKIERIAALSLIYR